MGLFDSPSHLLIILGVLVLLFGSAKLPKLARSLGESARIFKKETQKLHDEDAPSQVQAAAQQQLPAQPPAVTPQAQTVAPQAQQGPAAASTPAAETQPTNQSG